MANGPKSKRTQASEAEQARKQKEQVDKDRRTGKYSDRILAQNPLESRRQFARTTRPALTVSKI